MLSPEATALLVRWGAVRVCLILTPFRHRRVAGSPLAEPPGHSRQCSPLGSLHRCPACAGGRALGGIFPSVGVQHLRWPAVRWGALIRDQVMFVPKPCAPLQPDPSSCSGFLVLFFLTLGVSSSLTLKVKRLETTLSGSRPLSCDFLDFCNCTCSEGTPTCTHTHTYTTQTHNTHV